MLMHKTMTPLSLETTADRYIISIDKNTLDTDFVIQLIERLRMEQPARKIDFDEDIEELGKVIKARWWRENKSRLLGFE